MTKIKMLNDRIIFDGHADTKQECETITLMCDNLSKSKDFKTVRYESGYAEFEKVSKTEELKFIGSARVTINFDEHITKVTCDFDMEGSEWTTSGENHMVSFGGTPDGVFTVTLADGYVIASVTGTKSQWEETGSVSFLDITDNSFIFTVEDSTDYTITITSKIPAAKQTIDVSTLSGWANLATGNHQITIKTKASGYVDSEASNAVTVSKKPEPTLQYYGTATPLSVTRSYLAATTVGNHALFGGGSNSDGAKNTVDAYDTSLTRTIPTSLSVSRNSLAATSVGNYALFGGGGYGGTHNNVDAYDTSLTRTTPTALSVARNDLAATTVGNYALFGGGDGDDDRSTVVDAYDTSLTKIIPTALSAKRNSLAATSVGNYALFGGGFVNGNVVDSYNTLLTKTTPTALSVARYGLAATTVGNYALFGGGAESGSRSTVVDAYDTSLTRTIPTALSQKRGNLAATTVGNYALFGGGDSTGNGAYSTVVDAYDTSLTRTIPTALSPKRGNLAATTVGNYALFGGGAEITGMTGPSGVVNAYTVA